MKIDYLILIHKNPHQVIRLIKKLSCLNTYFFLHIDKTSYFYDFFNLLKKNRLKNIYFIERVNVHWGAFSGVKATMNGLRRILNTKIKFSYIILLSGQDYPIKSNNFIFKFLENNEGKEFIKYTSLKEGKWDHRIERYRFKWDHRIEKYYFTELNKGFTRGFINKFNIFLPRKKFFSNITPYGGDAWWCISYKFAKYIINVVNKLLKFVKYFKTVLIPDEHFFQTLACNSSFLKNTVNECLTYREFPGPKIFTTKDFNKLCNSNKLFARKFDINYNSNILDKIDKYIQ